jgi:hypothetical protein
LTCRNIRRLRKEGLGGEARCGKEDAFPLKFPAIDFGRPDLSVAAIPLRGVAGFGQTA